ncbi:MAG TPA: hypothetical protein PK685_02830 [archaeon]|nr:hypothetical protein [archaeon]
MVRALATAQVQSVREITKKADIKKTNKKLTVFVLAFFISLIVIYLTYLSYNYYVTSRFEYKESELGINFYSKEFGVRNSLNLVLNDSNVLVFANLKQEDTNNTEVITDTIVLLNTVYPAKNIPIITTINYLDNRGNLINCSTNKGDVYTNEILSKEDCLNYQKSENTKIFIEYPNSNLKESAVFVYPKEHKIVIKAKNSEKLITATYLILKSKYSDLEKILSKVEEIKKKLGETVLSDLNKTVDQNI